MWARFLEPERAYGQLKQLIGRDLYPNLFNKYPPFQIDGNLGAPAALAEMLLQSQGGEIRLLPALPAEWPDGHANGLCARGGFEVSENWNAGKLSETKIISKLGGNLRVSSAVPLSHADGTDLKIAAGENPNPYFAAPPIRSEFVSHFIETQTAGKVSAKEFVYDIPTNVGEMIELKTR